MLTLYLNRKKKLNGLYLANESLFHQQKRKYYSGSKKRTHDKGGNGQTANFSWTKKKNGRTDKALVCCAPLTHDNKRKKLITLSIKLNKPSIARGYGN